MYCHRNGHLSNADFVADLEVPVCVWAGKSSDRRCCVAKETPLPFPSFSRSYSTGVYGYVHSFSISRPEVALREVLALMGVCCLLYIPLLLIYPFPLSLSLSYSKMSTPSSSVVTQINYTL